MNDHSSNPSLSGKKILLTGAGGFIGSHLCQALTASGAEVTAMIRYSSQSGWGNLEFLPKDARAGLTVVAGNVEDQDFVHRQMKGKEIVFHLAALIGIPYSYAAPKSYIRTNIEGSCNIFEAARVHGVERVVHTSTSEVYGTALYTPINEAHPLQGQSPYSASKIAADKLAESYHRSFGLPVVTVRPFNAYGPRQSARAVIPTIISQALFEPEIRLGSLDPIRDMTFVEDSVAGFLAAATADCLGETINVGGGGVSSIGDIVEAVLRLLGCAKPVRLDPSRVRPQASEVLTLVCDNALAAQKLNWRPTVSLEQGLAKVAEFIAAHPDFIKTSIYAV